MCGLAERLGGLIVTMADLDKLDADLPELGAVEFKQGKMNSKIRFSAQQEKYEKPVQKINNEFIKLIIPQEERHYHSIFINFNF